MLVRLTVVMAGPPKTISESFYGRVWIQPVTKRCSVAFRGRRELITRVPRRGHANRYRVQEM
jgi:hypothetical protein